MSDDGADGEKDQGKEAKSPSRPVTAAARRERRGSARPAGKGAGADARQAPRGKASTPESSATGAKSAGKGRPTAKRDKGEKKASLFQRLARFIREVWAELRKVIWPTRKQMVTYTSVVVVFVAFMVALVFLLDVAFGELAGLVFGR